MAAPQFDALLAVQERDTVIDQLRHRRAALPDRAEKDRLEARRATVAESRDDVARQRDAVALRQSQIEAELTKSEARIKEIDRRMYSGEVSASRDLQVMADEISRLKVQCSDFEDQVLTALDEREPLDARVQELDDELAGIDRELADVGGRIAEAEAEIDAELATETAARDALAAGVPQALADRYEALRRKLGGIGAAPLNGASCGGCHLVLPATEVARIKREPPDALILCDQCGRILVRPG